MLGCSAAIAAMAGARLASASFYGPGTRRTAGDRILVVLFLRGGMDGLNFLGPADDKDYVAARFPNLRLHTSGDAAGLAMNNAYPGFDFRLHPRAAALKEIYDSGSLAMVHACGLPHGTRSHFEAMDMMERGVTDVNSGHGSGWLARYLADTENLGLLPAVAPTGALPASMLGAKRAVAAADLNSFAFIGDQEQAAALRSLYGGQGLLEENGKVALDATEAVRSRLPRNENGEVLPYQAENGASYPDGELGNQLKNVARLIKLDVGLHVAAVDFGGWDTHDSQEYRFPELVGHMAGSLGAFWNDIHAYHERVNVVVMSEFGRRLKANESRGTDHGHGNVMMVMGAGVQGGRMYGSWPGLATEQLDSQADLAITTDYRVVLSELLGTRFSVDDPARIFEGFKPGARVGAMG